MKNLLRIVLANTVVLLSTPLFSQDDVVEVMAREACECLTNKDFMVGKTVSVKVKDVECYIPKAKSYYSVKEIVELEIN